jgi:hypothetical protein
MALKNEELCPSIKDFAPSYLETNTPIAVLAANRFDQVRGNDENAYPNIPSLALQIATAGGLINPITKAIWTMGQLEEWNERIYQVFGHRNDLSQCRKHRGKYHVIIAGRRRFAATLLLQSKPEMFWSGYKEDPRECFLHFFTENTVLTRHRPNCSVEEAMEIMLAENLTQSRPHPSKEAKAIKELHTLAVRKAKDMKVRFNIKTFCSNLGISPGQVKISLWIEDLPDRIRRSIYDGDIRWSNGVVLAKYFAALIKTRCPDGTLTYTRETAEQEIAKHEHMAKVLKTKAFRKCIDAFIEEVARGQGNLFEDTPGEQLTVKNVQKRSFGFSTRNAGIEAIELLERLSKMVRSGEIARATSGEDKIIPLHDKETRRVLGILNRSTAGLTSLLLSVLSDQEISGLISNIRTDKAALEYLKDFLSEENGNVYILPTISRTGTES